MIIFFAGFNLSCVTLFDDPDIEYFGELISITGDKTFHVSRLRRHI